MYSLYDRLVTNQTKRDALMFDSLTSKVVTAVCAMIGAIAFVGIFFLAVTGGVALCAVRAYFGLLCDVHSRVVLVDCVWAGARPVGALRA
jgi:hypothetical protein